MKRVSVIIPTYNRGERLLKSVNSVLQQTYDNIELLIVDEDDIAVKAFRLDREQINIVNKITKGDV